MQYKTTVKEYLAAIDRNIGIVEQPDARSCQATCIFAVTGGDKAIGHIYDELDVMGVPGDPIVMAEYLVNHYGDRYSYHHNASIDNIIEMLKQGSVLITHGWFTESGHVITIDGYDREKGFHVMDPWSEFDGPKWAYLKDTYGFAGYYSGRMIYAACISGMSVWSAAAEYSKGAADRTVGGAWIHEIKPG